MKETSRMKYLGIAILVALFSAATVNATESNATESNAPGSNASESNASGQGVHLFVLSGQSNMVRLNPNVSFTPAVKAAFGKDNAIVVKDAVGAQPIRRWYKKRVLQEF